MHDYLKTLDTNQTIRIRIKLKPVVDNGAPVITVEVSDSFTIHTQLTDTIEIDTFVDLLENISVSIAMDGKQYSADKETAVIIEEFLIDDFSVLPSYTGHAVYSNDRNFNEPTNYLGFNGIWIFKLNEPFYHWRHKVTGQGWLLKP